jgi:hypothetical protein
MLAFDGCGHARERRSCEPRTRRRPIHPEPLGRPRHGNPRHIAHQSGTGTSASQGYEALYTPSQRPARAGWSEWVGSVLGAIAACLIAAVRSRARSGVRAPSCEIAQRPRIVRGLAGAAAICGRGLTPPPRRFVDARCQMARRSPISRHACRPVLSQPCFSPAQSGLFGRARQADEPRAVDRGRPGIRRATDVSPDGGGNLRDLHLFGGQRGFAYGKGGPASYILCYGSLDYVISYFMLVCCQAGGCRRNGNEPRRERRILSPDRKCDKPQACIGTNDGSESVETCRIPMVIAASQHPWAETPMIVPAG